jgi:PAS domain S-box-containing protein
MRNMDWVHMTCRGLLEALPDGLVLASAAEHILFANTQAARLFGYPAEELPGAEVDLLLPPSAAGAAPSRSV